MSASGVQVSTSRSAVAPVWSRLAAFGWDYILIILYLGSLRLLSLAVPKIIPLFQEASTAHLASFVLVTLPVGLYFALCEGATPQATLGKRLMHIRVESANYGRLGWAASFVRTAVKFTPWELSHAAVWRYRFAVDGAQQPVAVALLVTAWVIVIANVICLVTDRRRRALYDLVAGSVVCMKKA